MITLRRADDARSENQERFLLERERERESFTTPQSQIPPGQPRKKGVSALSCQSFSKLALL